jgi:diguanylate cyclase (GGDEF)-like protein/PAS domain S-box-containing protein
LVLRWSLILNLLFFLSDWRWYGQAHFAAAISARSGIVLVSLGCLLAARRIRGFRGLQWVCAAWSVPIIAASSVLVSPHNEIALFVIFVLPLIFYLAMPMAFRWTLALGTICSAATLSAFMASTPDQGRDLGLMLAMATINVVLSLVLIRANRLQRQEWTSLRSEQAANRELSEHRLMLQTLLQAVPAPLVIMAKDSGQLIQANDAAYAYFGYETPRKALPLGHFFDRRELVRLARSQPGNGQVAQFDTRLRLADGAWRDVLLVTTLAVVQGIEAILAIVIDITNRKEMEANLQKLAGTDPLTGLANRARFSALAADEIRRAQRYGRPLAVVMLDIDYFKGINDTYGHGVGDMALQAFAGLCRGMVREPDLVARLGGEEFALLLPETDRAGGLALAERLRAAVAAMRLAELPLAMTVSAGVADVGPGEDAVDAALARADEALYEAKRAGRNRSVLHRGRAVAV